MFCNFLKKPLQKIVTGGLVLSAAFFVSVRTDQNKNKRQNVIGNSLLFHDKADFSVGQYGLHTTKQLTEISF
mgnify:CR=1 FL=1